MNGVPTNVVGVVGTASWGPVGKPAIVSTMADFAATFGPVVPRKYDMGTIIATAVQQGAGNFRCVRVSDGTDTAAAFQIPSTSFVFTALYTGSAGNTVGVAMAPAGKAGCWKLTVSMPSARAEVFDNIGGTGSVFWQAVANAVNLGQGPQRGPSQIVVASPAGTNVPPLSFAWNFAAGVAGTDGAGVTAAALVGVDTLPRTGMYALRGQGCSVGVLADADDATQWTTEAGFGLSEGIYMILNMLLGTLAAMATSVVAYWVGSSAGSAQKTDLLARSTLVAAHKP
jgi:hypothetical protein